MRIIFNHKQVSESDRIKASQTYDADIIYKIKEMIEKGLDKLKSFSESEKYNLEYYNDMKERFKKISVKLKELKLCDEFKYFISICPHIEYIVYRNCIDPSFGHCSFAIELLTSYIKLIETNFDYYLGNTLISHDEYEKYGKEYKIKNRQYRREFYNEIYEFSGEYSQEELYGIHASLRM